MANGWKIGALVAVVAGVTVGGFALYSVLKDVVFGKGTDINVAVEEARKIGLPLTQDELLASFPVSDSDNAAPLLQAAIEQHQAIGGVLRSGEFRGKFLGGKAEKAEAVRYLQARAKVLETLRKATQRSGILWSRDWDMGAGLHFPEYSPMRELGTLLAVNAIYLAEQGQFDASIREIRAARRLAQLLAKDRTLIAFLVGLSCEAIACDAANRVMHVAPKNEAVLKKIEQELSMPLVGGFREIFYSECYMGIATVRNFEMFGGLAGISGEGGQLPKIDPNKLRREGLPALALNQAYMARLLEYWTQAIKELDAHPDDFVKVGENLDALTKKYASEGSVSAKIIPVAAPEFTRLALADRRNEANRMIHLAMCKALQHKARTGRMPTTLKEAGIDLKDPFGGGELRYVVRKDEALIYSIGQNLKDEGGARPSDLPGGASSEDGDVTVFSPPRPLRTR